MVNRTPLIAINQFEGGGKIGAKGHMSCNGNVHVTWGIY